MRILCVTTDELCSLHGVLIIKTVPQCVGAVTHIFVIKSPTVIKCPNLC